MTKEEIINKLKQSPVYNMSLNNKELFHSNFWWWLMDNYPEFIPVFFPIGENILKDKKKNIDYWLLREYKYTDLALKIKKNDDSKKFDVYVIENKLKSLANEEQLKRYSENIEYRLDKNQQKQPTEENFKQGILISFITPSFFEQNQSVKYIYGKIWKYISYDKIIDELKNQLKTNLKNKKNRKEHYRYTIILDYILMLKNIFDFLKQEFDDSFNKSCIKSNDNTSYNPNIGKLQKQNDDNTKYNDNTLEFLAKVIQMNAFWEYFDLNSDEECKGWEKEKIKIADKGKMPFITFKKLIDSKHYIGIQIENNQYRYFISRKDMNKVKKEDIKSSINIIYKDNKKWLDYGKEPSKQCKNICCSFNANPQKESGFFVYKHKTIINEENKNQKNENYIIYIKTFKDLKRQIISDMKKANDIIKNRIIVLIFFIGENILKNNNLFN